MKYLILISVLFHMALGTNSAYANHPGYDCTIDDKMHCEGNDEAQIGNAGTGKGNEGDEGEEPEIPQ